LKNGLLTATHAFLIILSIAFLIFIILSVTESFSQKDESIDISVVKSI